MDARVDGELDQALARCQEEPFPDASTALRGVTAEPPAALPEWYRQPPVAGLLAESPSRRVAE